MSVTPLARIAPRASEQSELRHPAAPHQRTTSEFLPGEQFWLRAASFTRFARFPTDDTLFGTAAMCQ